MSGMFYISQFDWSAGDIYIYFIGVVRVVVAVVVVGVVVVVVVSQRSR